MIKNDILKKLRYILDYGDSKMIEVFSHTGFNVSRETLSNWLKRDDDKDYVTCNDLELSHFLNGLIIEKRGRVEGKEPKAEKKLTNNMAFKAIMIAFSLKSEDAVEVLALADLRVSKHELSAFFRKPGHKNYRDCKAQILRNFLMGLQLRERPSSKKDESIGDKK